MYPERLQKFMEQIHAKYPKIKICGSSGPSADGKDFDYGWEQMRKLGVDMVDEHYYKESGMVPQQCQPLRQVRPQGVLRSLPASMLLMPK